MNKPKNYKPEPVQTEHLDAFLKRINESGKRMPTHIVIGHDGMPIYGQSIPFMLMTGGTILSDPYSDRDLRVVAFEDIDASPKPSIKEAANTTHQTAANQTADEDTANPVMPTLVRVVVRGSDDDRVFRSDFN